MRYLVIHAALHIAVVFVLTVAIYMRVANDQPFFDALTHSAFNLGPIVGPAGTFAPLPDIAKWIMALAMLMGRLEILAVLVIFTPVFWER